MKYLWETTDEEHTASLADITAYLQGCGIPKPDARTLRKDIDQLIEFGIDIVHHRGVQNRYHVATRHFEAPELKLLIDAVQSSRFVTPKKSRALIGRLAVFAGPNQSELLNRELYVDSRYKSGNESIYLAVDSIQTAIEQKKKISFQYFDYAPDKTKLLRHDGRRYSVSPYALIWNNDAYYLIGYHDMRGIVTRFRRIASPVWRSWTSQQWTGWRILMWRCSSQKSFPCWAAGTVKWNCSARTISWATSSTALANRFLQKLWMRTTSRSQLRSH